MPRPMIALAASSLLLFAAEPLSAQGVAPLGLVAALAPVGAQRGAGVPTDSAPMDTDATRRTDRRDRTRPDSAGRLRTDYSPGERFAMRSVVGTLAWLGGAYVGARIGAGSSTSNCGCEDPGYESGAIGGALLGGITGTTVLVSAMGMGDRCDGASRATLTAIGAALGTVLGIGGAVGVRTAWAIPIGGGLGGAVGAATCTPKGSSRRR